MVGKMKFILVIILLFSCLLAFAGEKPRAEYYGIEDNRFSMKDCQMKKTFEECIEEFKQYLLEKSARSGKIETGYYIGGES